MGRVMLRIMLQSNFYKLLILFTIFGLSEYSHSSSLAFKSGSGHRSELSLIAETVQCYRDNLYQTARFSSRVMGRRQEEVYFSHVSRSLVVSFIEFLRDLQSIGGIDGLLRDQESASAKLRNFGSQLVRCESVSRDAQAFAKEIDSFKAPRREDIFDRKIWQKVEDSYFSEVRRYTGDAGLKGGFLELAESVLYRRYECQILEGGLAAGIGLGGFGMVGAGRCLGLGGMTWTVAKFSRGGGFVALPALTLGYTRNPVDFGWDRLGVVEVEGFGLVGGAYLLGAYSGGNGRGSVSAGIVLAPWFFVMDAPGQEWTWKISMGPDSKEWIIQHLREEPSLYKRKRQR